MKRIRLLLAAAAAVLNQAVTADWVVEGPRAPKPWEKTAQAELSGYLKRIVRSSLSIGGKRDVVFHVGDTDFAVQKGLTSRLMADEQWVVRSYGSDILLNGGGTHGALYAVYHFLEDSCGVRWWSQVEENVPSVETLELPAQDLGGRPAFRFRLEWGTQRERDSHLFAVRCRLSDNYGAMLPETLGGGFTYGRPGGCHTFERYLPAKEHFKDHPEWFEYNRKTGRRNDGIWAQVCLTNPEVREIFRRKLRAYIEEDRARAKERGVPPPYVYDVSQNDSYPLCECDACYAAQQKWGDSGLMIDFVNDVAGSVKEDYPEVLVQMFAYHRTTKPPKGGKRAADNVVVRFCDTSSNQAAGVFEPDNDAYREQLAGWAKACRHLNVWDYSVTYPARSVLGLPFPSEFHYAEMYRLCLQSGAVGFLMEHENPHAADMYELKYYLERHLMEDPYLDDHALIRTFMREYYGPAAAEVATYRLELEKLRKAKRGRVTWVPMLDDFGWIDDGATRRFCELLAKAESATGGKEPWLSRVRRVRVGVDRLICQRARTTGDAYNAFQQAAADRLTSFWPAWMAKFKSVGEQDRLQLMMGSVPAPKPKAFRGKKIVDYPACLLNCREECGMTRVSDPASEFGQAVVEPADHERFKLPIGFCAYSFGQKKGLCGAKFDKPLSSEKEYAWYRVGEADLDKDTDVILTPSWELSLAVKYRSELFGKRWEIFVSAKYTGPKYHPGSTEPNRIYIDRVVLVEQNADVRPEKRIFAAQDWSKTEEPNIAHVALKEFRHAER